MQTTMPVYMLYMSSMQSTMWPLALGYIYSHCRHMPLNKYACHTLYIHVPLHYCTYMFHCTSTIIYIPTPHYFTYQHISVSSKYALEMSNICNLCQVLPYIYILYMNSLQWTILPAALVYTSPTLLEHAPEQICLPHCTCLSHYNFAIAHI